MAFPRNLEKLHKTFIDQTIFSTNIENMEKSMLLVRFMRQV